MIHECAGCLDGARHKERGEEEEEEENNTSPPHRAIISPLPTHKKGVRHPHGGVRRNPFQRGTTQNSSHARTGVTRDE